MAARSNFYLSQLVSEADVDQAFDDLENADRALVADLGFVGVMTGLVASEHSPNNMTIDVTGGTAYDPDGARTVVPSTQTVNLAVDHASVTTAVVTGGNSKVLSLFVKFARALSQPETDGTGTTVYYRRDESFSFYVKQGSEAVSPTPPSLEADGILLCDVTIAHGATTIVDGDISTARRQDLVVLSGTPLGTSGTGGRYGTYLAALQAIVTRYDNHVNAVADQHPASQINYAGGPTWANGDNADKIGVTTVEAAIDAVATKIGATTTSHSGADLVGCAQMVGTYATISGATLFQTLTALRSCANLEYAGGPVWANADNADKIGAQALEGALDAVASKLGATTASHSGLHLIGGATCGNFTAGTAYSFFSQLTAVTSSDDGAKRIGTEAVGNFAGATLRAQLTELTATTSSNDGAKRIGAQANGGLSSGTVRSQLDELDTRDSAKAPLAGATFTGAVRRSGSTAWGVRRYTSKGSPGASTTISVAADVYSFGNPTLPCTVDVTRPSGEPAGIEIEVFAIGGLSDHYVFQDNGATMVTFETAGGDGKRGATFLWNGSAWLVSRTEGADAATPRVTLAAGY